MLKKGKTELNLNNPRVAAVIDLLDWIDTQQIRFRERPDFINPLDYSLYRFLISDAIRHCRMFYFVIESLTQRKINKLDREVLASLLIGLVQLMHLDKINEYAAVNETVNLLVFFDKKYLKGFVNANLRSFIRKRKSLLELLKKQELSTRTSHPDWMTNRWIKQYGEQVAVKICESNNILPQLQVVSNPSINIDVALAELADKKFNIVDIHSKGFTIQNPAGFFDTPLAQNGSFLVQDRSSQLLNSIVQSLPKKRVLDACASPGGKLFHLEWYNGGEIDELIGFDISKFRIRRLDENKKRLKSKALIVQADARISCLKKLFDLILVDAPCSGTGVIQKHPEIKWDRKIKNFKTNQQSQLDLLNGLKDNIRVGGHILYSTCSLEKEENQMVIERFLADNISDFSLIPIQIETGEDMMIDENGCFQCLPNGKQMGVFAALLKRV